MRKCKICGDKYEPKHSSLEPCPKYECRLKLAEKIIPKAKKQVEKQHFDELKEKVKTHSDWKKELQAIINTIVRNIDKGHPCISSGRPLNAKYDCGHRFHASGNSHITFNLLNLFAQSVEQNQYKSGNPDGYDKGLLQTFGTDILNEVHDLKSKYHGLIIDTQMIKDALPIAKSILKAVIAENRVYSTEDRIALRKKFNKMIGIYQK